MKAEQSHGFQIYSDHSPGFTLIELLIVIAIIAILAVVVVLVLQPQELLRQSRDSNRLSDMATLTNALNLYNTDQGGASGYSLGNTANVYVSVPDSSSTCGDLGLPSGNSYVCASSTSSRTVGGSGWIPVNLTTMSAGSPLGSLPADPTNQTSSGLYYTYTTNGTQFQIISLMESSKYKSSVTGSLGSGIDEAGSLVGASPVGWWTLNEGSGTTAYDTSGNGNNGTWSGSEVGTSGYYSPGKVSSWAGAFDGVSTDVSISLPTGVPSSQETLALWFNPTSNITSSSPTMLLFGGTTSGGGYSDDLMINSPGCGYTGSVQFYAFTTGAYCASSAQTSWNAGQWYYIVGTRNGSNIIIYVNGASSASSTYTGTFSSLTKLEIGSQKYVENRFYFPGLIDDVRIYNRALSPAEILAIYNAKN